MKNKIYQTRTEAITAVFLSTQVGEYIGIHLDKDGVEHVNEDTCPCYPIVIQKTAFMTVEDFLRKFNEELGH